MTGWFLYFAYGSNLHPERLRQRTSSAEPLGAAVLGGHRLRFHKRGRDGSAKCDAHHTGVFRDRIHGGLYRIAEAQRAGLDRAESLGVGYDALLLPVRSGGDLLRAWTYRARAAFIEPGLVPFDWYLDYVISGARYFGLPGDYVDELSRIPSLEDPDRSRGALNREVLTRLR